MDCDLDELNKSLLDPILFANIENLSISSRINSLQAGLFDNFNYNLKRRIWHNYYHRRGNHVNLKRISFDDHFFRKNRVPGILTKNIRTANKL